MSVLLAALASIAYGSADFAGGRATRTDAVSGILIFSQSVGLLGVIIIALILRQSLPETRDLLWGALSGLSGVVGLAALYTGLATARVAVVSPAAALVGTAAPIIAGVLFGESPTLLGWLGIALALPSILLLSLSGERGRQLDLRSLVIGLLAGLGFGGYYILIDRTSDGSGFWPLAAARVASIGAILVFALARGLPFVPKQRGSRVFATVAGALDMAANVFFLLAVRLGILVTASVVSSLYPGPTVLLARIVDHERLGLRRIAGLALALCGVAFMVGGTT